MKGHQGVGSSFAKVKTIRSQFLMGLEVHGDSRN